MLLSNRRFRSPNTLADASVCLRPWFGLAARGADSSAACTARYSVRVQRFHHAFVALLALGPLAACASDTGADTGETGEYVCGSAWFGALPGYAEPSLSIRACLNESNCSDEHVLTTERGASRAYENFHLSAHYYPSGSGHYLNGEEDNLDVVFNYGPEFSPSLTDSDRATLVVKADDGSVMMESTSEVPYRSSTSSRGETCKFVSLDLDGSER